MSGIYSLLSGAKVSQRLVENTTNNIANANTNGYKADRPVFKQYLDKAVGVDLESEEEGFVNKEFLSPYSLGSTTYTVLDNEYVDQQQGSTIMTNNDLDVMIQGNGFFVVDTPHGFRYTRDGTFSRDSEGFLVNANGHYVMGEDGRINIAGEWINILEDGQVEVDQEFKDKLYIADFDNPENLNKVGKNYFVPKDKSQVPNTMETPTIKQGLLEGSMTDTVSEMVNLISANRHYEATQRGIKLLDEIDQKSNSIAKMG